jgi:type II secretory pathway pseudopilin PulG
MFIAKWAPLILLLALPGLTAARQSQAQTQSASDQQQDSLAAAARRAREAKKDQAKPAKVWDNETVASTTGAISIVGQPAPPPSNPALAAGVKSPAGNPPAADKSAIEANLSAAKANLRSLKVDLDLLQRKYALDQQTYYGTPNYSSDTAGATALADEKSQVDSKQQAVADTEKKVADLQAQWDAADKSSSSAH